MPEQFSAEAYFATQPPPHDLDSSIESLKAFVDRQRQAKRRVAFVTSGGTTVPLEHNVVRFLDNFSAGTRGATSAEYFLQHGYAVIFMHRQYSLQPFSRHYSHSVNPFLDFLEIVPDHNASATTPAADGSTTHTRTASSDVKIEVDEATTPELAKVLKTYKAVKKAGTLHTLTFVTVNDYLFLLRAISHELSKLGPNVIYYLAAAVSDFFLPMTKMSEHKIQSGKGSLIIEMDQVPKILKPMVDEWTPEGFIVSFKLETDLDILIPKARAALERYGHQLVIGNTLQTRKWEVVFVTRQKLYSSTHNAPPDSGGKAASEDVTKGRVDEEGDGRAESAIFVEKWLKLKEGKTEIEEDIILELTSYHDAWVEIKGGWGVSSSSKS